VIKAIVLFPLLILSLYGLGNFIRGIFLGDENFSAGKVGRSLAFGILAHGLLMTLLGFTGLLTPVIASVVTVLPVFIFFKFWLPDLKSLFSKSSWKSITPFNIYEKLFLGLISIITLLRGFNALAPNISWDATSHHYLVPSAWLESGRVSDLPSVIFSYYPSLIEMGIAGTMALGSDFLSNLYGWLFGIVAALMLYSICVRHFDILGVETEDGENNIARMAGLAAALFFTLFPGVGVQTSGGYVDLPLAVWILFTIDLLMNLQKNPSWKALTALGLVSGAVLATKHIGLIIFPGFIIYLVWALSSGNQNRESKAPVFPYALVFIAISLLIPMAWYVRSFLFTGNSIFPFGGEFGLPTLPHPPFTSESWVRPDYDRSIIGLLTYWLHLAFSPNVAAALGCNYSMAFPFLLPLVLLIPKLKISGRYVVVLSLVSVLVIYKLFPVETRYHLPFLAAMALSFGILFGSFFANPKYIPATVIMWLSGVLLLLYLFMIGLPFNYLFIGLVAVITVTGLEMMLFKKLVRPASFGATLLILILIVGVNDIRPDLIEMGKRYKAVLNIESEDKYMLRESPLNYGAIHHINYEENWEEMRVLCLEPRVYRLKADWVTWFGLDEAVVPTSPAENVAIWYRGGFTHILLGDDVSLKALMYYNIVHNNGWDIPGASPEELVEWIVEHPEEDEVIFSQADLWYNLRGDPMVTSTSAHFRNEWLSREIEKELYPESEPGVYTASRLSILTDPESLAQYSFVRDFREMLETGGIKVAWTDELTVLFECDYPAYLESHPDVDLQTLGLE